MGAIDRRRCLVNPLPWDPRLRGVIRERNHDNAQDSEIYLSCPDNGGKEREALRSRWLLKLSPHRRLQLAHGNSRWTPKGPLTSSTAFDNPCWSCLYWSGRRTQGVRRKSKWPTPRGLEFGGTAIFLAFPTSSPPPLSSPCHPRAPF